MKALSSVDIHYLVSELHFLVGAKIDKIYHPEKKELLLQFHITGTGKKILKITDKTIYLAQTKEEGKEPTSFCMFLRKHLDNSRLKEISQIEPERIVRLVFETKEGTRNLIAELFGGGNFIVCDEKETIISALEFHKFKDRDINKGVAYSYPKKEIDIFNIKQSSIEKAVKNTGKESMVAFLAVDIGLGGVYSEEVCILAKIDKNKGPKNLKDEEMRELATAIKKITKSKIEAEILYEGEIIKAAAPFPLEIYSKNNKKPFSSFSEAVEFFLSNEQPKEPKQDKGIERIKKIIEKQKEQIAELSKEEDENRKKAELIYNNYPLIDEILREINKAKEKYSWEEIKEKLKGHKIIKEIDLKDKKIVVEID